MLKNLCNNFFKLTKAKIKKMHIIIGLVSMFSTFCGTFTAFAQSLFTVKLSIDDGKEYEFKTSKKTVSSFLKYEEIDFIEGDKINVKLDDIIDKDLTIKIKRANLVKLVVDGEFQNYRVQDMKVSQFLQEENIPLGEKDIISENLDTFINEDITIYLNRAEKVNFLIDNKEKVEFITNKGNIGLALKEFCEEKGINVYLEEGQSSATNIKNDMVIKVSSFKEEIKTIKEDIPFQTEIIENDNLLENVTNVQTKGENGIKEIKVKEIYKDGNLESKETIEEKIIKEPITEVIEKGTKEQYSKNQFGASSFTIDGNTIKTEQGTFIIDEKRSMKSSAYTAGPESTGKNPGDAGYGITASGRKAQRGVVAVDTNVIPFGTELYIEGYGYAVAGDTGSAIKGNKIDVFFDDYSDAIKYGVRNVDVYVLGEKVS